MRFDMQMKQDPQIQSLLGLYMDQPLTFCHPFLLHQAAD